MLCGRNEQQIKDHPLSSIWISCLEDLYSSSYAVTGLKLKSNLMKYHFNADDLPTKSNLKHFYGKYSVIRSFHFKCANIRNDDIHILQLQLPDKRPMQESDFGHHTIGFSQINNSVKKYTRISPR